MRKSPRRAAGNPLQLLLRPVPISLVQAAVLLGVLFVIPFFRITDNDFWWHLRTGELIVHHGIPRHDPFSWTAAGKDWVTHEWLAEAIIYLLQSAVGYAANVVIFSGATAGSLVLMYGLGRRAGAGTRPLALLLCVSVLIFGVFLTVRPQIFSWRRLRLSA